jgi:NAD(P)-dependent dehydrogenase (short-subunit alcohol dehydrogenase family)
MSVVLITGCSSGFGLASAIAFARNGDTVYASMRDTSKGDALRELAAQETLDIRLAALDVTKPASFPPLVEMILAQTGRLDVLVNNAGILRAGAFEDLDETSLRGVMETNFFGPFLLARSVLPHMRQQRSGYIIMISSLSGIAGLPGDVAYSASKFAVEGATEALRHEIDRWQIKLALVEAGQYATHIFDASIAGTRALPVDYPLNSPYRPLVEHRLRDVCARLPQAFDAAIVGELLVRISKSDGRQLRWPADAVARKVLATMLGHDDAARDKFLRGVSGTDWWSDGGSPPAAPARASGSVP